MRRTITQSATRTSVLLRTQPTGRRAEIGLPIVQNGVVKSGRLMPPGKRAAVGARSSGLSPRHPQNMRLRRTHRSMKWWRSLLLLKSRLSHRVLTWCRRALCQSIHGLRPGMKQQGRLLKIGQRGCPLAMKDGDCGTSSRARPRRTLRRRKRWKLLQSCSHRVLTCCRKTLCPPIHGLRPGKQRGSLLKIGQRGCPLAMKGGASGTIRYLSRMVD
mmetsp:Transcript_41561/g.110023  ORF Transcript_41561/g.110023 Transcript_41561/m.110023 type:complete len:215 (+) Transcript_41561:332-976(+)